MDKDEISREVYKKCNTYPKPNYEDIQSEVKKYLIINKNFNNKNLKQINIIESISTAFDLKKQLESDEWIYYDK